VVNRVLKPNFAGEAAMLARALDRGRIEVPGYGLSSLAVVERSAAAADTVGALFAAPILRPHGRAALLILRATLRKEGGEWGSMEPAA
jgi:hypothetical protein